MSSRMGQKRLAELETVVARGDNLELGEALLEMYRLSAVCEESASLRLEAERGLLVANVTVARLGRERDETNEAVAGLNRDVAFWKKRRNAVALEEYTGSLKLEKAEAACKRLRKYSVRLEKERGAALGEVDRLRLVARERSTGVGVLSAACDIANLRGELVDMTNERDSAQAELVNLRSQATDMKIGIDTTLDEVRRLKAASSEAIARCPYRPQLVQLRIRYADMKVELERDRDAARDVVADLRDKNETLKSNVQFWMKETRAFTAYGKLCKAERDELRDKLATATKAGEIYNEVFICRLTRERNALQNVLALAYDIEEAVEDNVVKCLRRQRDRGAELLAGRVREAAGFQAEVATLRGRLSKVELSLERRRTQSAGLQGTIALLQKRLAGFHEELDEVCADRDKALADLASNKKHADTVANTVVTLRVKLSGVYEELANAFGERNTARASVEALQRECNRLTPRGSVLPYPKVWTSSYREQE